MAINSVAWLPHKIHFMGRQHLKGWRLKMFGQEVIDGPLCGSEPVISDPNSTGTQPARMTSNKKEVTCKRCQGMLERRTPSIIKLAIKDTRVESTGLPLQPTHSGAISQNQPVKSDLSRFPDMRYRFASAKDSDLIAPMNLQLIKDEGHRNAMDIPQLAKRMASWLQGEYQAVLFEENGIPVGYALFRHEPEFVYLRQLYVVSELRRQGIARNALHWLWANAWSNAPRLRIEVLVGNVSGREFWWSVGFTEYCVTMEAASPSQNE